MFESKALQFRANQEHMLKSQNDGLRQLSVIFAQKLKLKKRNEKFDAIVRVPKHHVEKHRTLRKNWNEWIQERTKKLKLSNLNEVEFWNLKLNTWSSFFSPSLILATYLKSVAENRTVCRSDVSSSASFNVSTHIVTIGTKNLETILKSRTSGSRESSCESCCSKVET